MRKILIILSMFLATGILLAGPEASGTVYVPGGLADC